MTRPAGNSDEARTFLTGRLLREVSSASCHMAVCSKVERLCCDPVSLFIRPVKHLLRLAAGTHAYSHPRCHNPLRVLAVHRFRECQHACTLQSHATVYVFNHIFEYMLLKEKYFRMYIQVFNIFESVG